MKIDMNGGNINTKSPKSTKVPLHTPYQIAAAAVSIIYKADEVPKDEDSKLSLVSKATFLLEMNGGNINTKSQKPKNKSPTANAVPNPTEKTS